ncbi:MAG: hypothetical protein QNJ31_00220 [Candidatus Caenarcaniphilales bacterium]|nr:hypothetical protein [Candidatus Caenarcaniphilales bacterium]
MASLLIWNGGKDFCHANSIIKDNFLALNTVSSYKAQNKLKKEKETVASKSELEKSHEKETIKKDTSRTSALDLSPVSLVENNKDQARFEGDKVNYDSEKDLFVIEGNANIYLDDQNIKISADRIEYLKAESQLKAYGNVLILGKEQVTYAKYMEIEIEDNKADLDEVDTQLELASINAEKGVLKTTKTRRYGDYTNGDFKIATPIRLASRIPGQVSSNFENIQSEEPDYILREGQSYSLSANKLNYYPDRVQNNLHIFGGKLKFKKFPLSVPIPYYIFTAGESTEQMFQAAIGSNPNTGAGDFNLGPMLSFVVGDPKKERAVRFAPFLQFGSATGYGGMAQYSDKRNDALIAYGAAKDRGLAEVRSRLTKRNNFSYGWNSYIGGGITEQFFQLDDQRDFEIPYLSALLEGEQVHLHSDLTYAVDSDSLRNSENNLLSDLQRDSVGSSASNVRERRGLRAQQRLFFTTKPLIEFGTENYNAGLRIVSSSNARIYSTGNINAFTSVGPNLRMHLHKYADLSVGYDQLLPAGRSPFGFDQVIQGQESIYAHGDFNVTRWLSIGGSLVYSLSRENFITQQARIILGPEDFKLVAGYDPVLRRFNLGFSLFFNDKVSFKQFSYKENTSGRKRRF